MPPSPAPAASFEALPIDPEGGPPDTHGAVGPSHLMVTLNTQVRIQDRSGRALSTVSLSDFWRGVGGRDHALVRPARPLRPLRRPLDHERGSGTPPRCCCRSLLVGVSQTGDPTGSWNLYRVDPTWVDFQTLGFNKDWIVVQGHHNRNVLPLPPQHADLGLREGGPLRGRDRLVHVDLRRARRRAFGGVPAVTLDPAVSALYLVQHWNGNADGNGVLRLYTITGSIGSEVLTPVAFVATPNPWSNSPATRRFLSAVGSPEEDQLRREHRGGLPQRHDLGRARDLSAGRRAHAQRHPMVAALARRRRRAARAPGRRLGRSLLYGFPSLAVNGQGRHAARVRELLRAAVRERQLRLPGR